MAIDSKNKTRCEKCDIGCIKCFGTIENNQCIECHKDYQLYKGKCLANCIISGNEYCYCCNENEGKINRCKDCNYGYYLPEYSNDINKNLVCQKCPPNCLICIEEGDNLKCILCDLYSILYNGTCFKSCPYMENCLNCDQTEGYPICIECNKGFYFPSNTNKIYEKCYKCSTFGYNYCEGETEYKDQCLECKEGYEPILKEDKIYIQRCFKNCEIGGDNKCKSCSNKGDCGECNDDFELIDGICLLKEYDILARYKAKKIGKKLQ